MTARDGAQSVENDAGRALAKRLTSEEMIELVARAVSDAQVHGHVEYKRRVGYHGRLSIARTVLDAICEGLEIPTSLDLRMDPDPIPAEGTPQNPVDGATHPCPTPGYAGRHTAVGAGAISSPYVCHGCGTWFLIPPAEPCRECGPGYRIGDEGCRHAPLAEPAPSDGAAR